MATFLIYAGVIVAVVGLIATLIPPRFLGLRSRRPGLIVLLLGLVCSAVGVLLPVRVVRVATPAKAIDRYLPEYQARETRSIRIHATPARVGKAIRSVTALEIRPVAWLDGLRPSSPTRLRHAMLGKRMCEILHRAGFVVLEEEEDGDLALGAIGRFWGGGLAGGDRALYARGVPNVGSSARIMSGEEFVRFHRPGYAKGAIDFHIADTGGGWSVLSTEVRALGTDAAARRDFERTWRVIAPGTSFVRGQWLEAIRRRAEAPAPADSI